jgi:hypothetical protein
VTDQGVRVERFGSVSGCRREVLPQTLVYLLLNMPVDVLCTSSDEADAGHSCAAPDLGIRV